MGGVAGAPWRAPPLAGVVATLAAVLPAVLLSAVLLSAIGGCSEDDSRPSRDLSSPPPGEEPRTVEARRKMVEQLAEFIDDRRVLEAMRRVPRHEFVSEALRPRAYELRATLPIPEEQTISSPEYVAIMTAALDLQGNEKVLEVGTGSGYQAAVLGEIVDEVYTIEIRPRLAELAEKRLRELRERGALSYKKLEVIEGNGYNGYKPAEKYDAIIVTAAPRQMPTELVNQLRVGGRMVIPIGDFYQELQVITKKPNNALEGKIIQTVRFVRMEPGD